MKNETGFQTCDADWTILFVDDGSTDGTVKHIEFLQHKDKRVGYLTLSRNFWQGRIDCWVGLCRCRSCRW